MTQASFSLLFSESLIASSLLFCSCSPGSSMRFHLRDLRTLGMGNSYAWSILSPWTMHTSLGSGGDLHPKSAWANSPPESRMLQAI